MARLTLAVTASGGNHGLAVAYAARASECPAIVYLPHNSPADKIEKIKGWGADVVVGNSEAWVSELSDDDLRKLVTLEAGDETGNGR